MKNSAGRGGCYPPRLKAEVDNILRDLQNSSYSTNEYHAFREILRHPGRTLDLKTRGFIGSDQMLLFISQSQSRISMGNLQWYYTMYTFCTVLHLNCTVLSQSKSSNFFMCIIIPVTVSRITLTLRFSTITPWR